MRARYAQLCLALLAVPALGSPLRAQSTHCDSCSTTWTPGPDRLDQARQALDAAVLELGQRRAAWFNDDTSRAARDALAQAEREVARAQRTYQRQALEAMRERVRGMEREARAMRRARADQQRAAQQGWLGITLSSDRARGKKGGDLPVIVAVDPDSPADRAGLEAGDRLVSVDGHTLRNGMPAFGRILMPGARVPVRIRRGDDTKELMVLVGRKPHAYAFGFRMDDDGVDEPAPDAPTLTPMPPVPPGAPLVPVAPLPEAAPAAPFSGFYFNGVATIAGAQLWDVDELKGYFHVSDGLLVLRVLPGTPAARAGLRSGDVIVRADGRGMSSVHALERALENADQGPGAHTAQLAVVRQGKPIDMALRW